MMSIHIKMIDMNLCEFGIILHLYVMTRIFINKITGTKFYDKVFFCFSCVCELQFNGLLATLTMTTRPWSRESAQRACHDSRDRGRVDIHTVVRNGRNPLKSLYVMSSF